jgi:hypothetical protein
MIKKKEEGMERGERWTQASTSRSRTRMGKVQRKRWLVSCEEIIDTDVLDNDTGNKLLLYSLSVIRLMVALTIL